MNGHSSERLFFAYSRPSFNHASWKLSGFAFVASLALIISFASKSSAAPDPRAVASLTVDTTTPKNLFWETAPVIKLHLKNKCEEALTPLRYEVHAIEQYYEREAWSVRDAFRDIPAGAEIDREEMLTVPYGAFQVKWLLADAQGEIASGSINVSRMPAQCFQTAPEAIRIYDQNWSIFGGVFGFLSPKLATDMGARWNRYEDTVWDSYEKTPGRFDMAPLAEGVKRWKDVGVECVIFQTLYQHPEFHAPEQPDFAIAYGAVMKKAAETVKGVANGFELGNEDNGPTKMIYTEVARNGAAGIRSAQPDAFIANSGTAYIDLNWLGMQADRNLYDALDVLCTHPYTAGDSPEAWGVFDKLLKINEIIDRLGGMKLQWTTEFGWPHDFSPQRRSEWIPRHFAIGAAAGVERHGLYTWERDYGIFQDTAQPSAVSTHAMAKILEGSRFAGLLSSDNNLWAVVFERAGKPVIMAWSPVGNALREFQVNPDFTILDLFGNPFPTTVEGGVVKTHITGAPIYVTGCADAILAQAYANQCASEHKRFSKILGDRKNPERSDVWSSLAAKPDASGEDLRKALLEWAPKTLPISRQEQALAAQALRWYWTAGRMIDPAAQQNDSSEKIPSLESRLAESVANDADIPSLRYLLNRWKRLGDEEAVAREFKADVLATRLRSMRETVATLCEKFAENGERINSSLWPYLYNVAKDGTLQETIRIIPGQPTEMKLRVVGYNRIERQVAVSFSLPEGWKCAPEAISLTVKPGQIAEAQLRFECTQTALNEPPKIRAKLSCEGCADREVTFDDIKVEAPVEISLDTMKGLPPQTPFKGTLSNQGAAPITGLVRFMRHGDSRAIARQRFDSLTAEKPLNFSFSTQEKAASFPYHNWPFNAEIILSDGKRIYRDFSADFACATRAKNAPNIDGNLSDWAFAAPLRLDRAEYAKGSFGTKWTPEDCSAITYTMWDESNLYFAAEVRDQTFNQTLTGESIWMQDSIQLAFARDASSPDNGVGFALTPKGNEVTRYYGADKNIPGAIVKVVPEQGKTTYEAAIPWSQLVGLEKPVVGSTFRYSALVNDDDAITGRRFLERYGGIAHDNDISKFGYLTLLDDTGDDLAPPPNGSVIFQEDFEEYDNDAQPDAWETVVHLAPFPEMVVREGVGRNGSKGLLLTNDIGEKQDVYKIVVRSLMDSRPGQQYEMRFWFKGRGVENASAIVGVCSDKWGNVEFSYANPGPMDDVWRETTFTFIAPNGSAPNIIIRNATTIENLVLDSFVITLKK
jgi:hypothetical protein